MGERSAFKRFEKSVREKVRRLRLRTKPGGSLILRIHDSVQGQLHLKESVWLYTAAREKKTIVEIGSFRGRSTTLLAAGSAPGGIVYAIDPHLDFEQDSAIHYGEDDAKAFAANIERFGFTPRVRKIKMLSSEAMPAYAAASEGGGAGGGRSGAPIDLLWIDGDHHYAAVKRDLQDWAPLVKVGGTVACHDYTWWEDVRRAWAETIGADPQTWRVEGQCQAIIWATRLR